MHDFPLRRRARLACLIAIWGPLMACQPTAPAAGPSAPPTATAQAGDRSKNDKSAQEHLYRLNPSPKQGVDIEFEVHDAPGTFADAMSNANYQSFNCNYVTSEWAGARASPSKMTPLPVTRLDTNRFVVTVYQDGLLDEDYFGTGVCHWELTAVSLGLRATGAADDTAYAVLLGSKDIMPGHTVQQYYWKGSYPRTNTPTESGIAPSVSGVSKPDDLLQGFRDNVFSITAKVRTKP